MCGRYTVSSRVMKEIEAELGLKLPEPADNPNVAPSGAAPVVGLFGETIGLRTMKWGLVPHWSAQPSVKYSTINARIETAALKPAYRDPMRRGRCLVPASGFYEWRTENGRKIPCLFTPSGRESFVFAGLFDTWRKGPDLLQTFTILVGEPNTLVAACHHRMPVILAPGTLARWLDPATSVADALALATAPFPPELMKMEQKGPPRTNEIPLRT